MAIKTKPVKNALVTYDDRYNERWLDAVGVDVVNGNDYGLEIIWS